MSTHSDRIKAWSEVRFGSPVPPALKARLPGDDLRSDEERMAAIQGDLDGMNHQDEQRSGPNMLFFGFAFGLLLLIGALAAALSIQPT